MTCVVCNEPSNGSLCKACGRSYDRGAHDEGSIREVMRWAANRACRRRGSDRIVQLRKLLTDMRDHAEEDDLPHMERDSKRALAILRLVTRELKGTG
jgi:hypothetical protein